MYDIKVGTIYKSHIENIESYSIQYIFIAFYDKDIRKNVNAI